MISDAIVTFEIDAALWQQGRIRYTCSLCGSSDDGGPITNRTVHTEMRQHLKKKHRLVGTSLLRSETELDEGGAIRAIEFFRTDRGW